MLNINEQDQIFFMEYIGIRMPEAVKKVPKEIITIGLDDDMTEENKQTVRNILSTGSRFDFVKYINEQNIIEEYSSIIQKVYNEPIDKIEIVGYIFEGKQYNFIKATEDTETFKKDEWYTFEEIKNDEEEFNPEEENKKDDKKEDIPGVLVFYSPKISDPFKLTLEDSIKVLKDAATAFRILREVKIEPFK